MVHSNRFTPLSLLLMVFISFVLSSMCSWAQSDAPVPSAADRRFQDKRRVVESTIRNALSHARAGRFKTSDLLLQKVTADLLHDDASALQADSLERVRKSMARLRDIADRETIRTGAKVYRQYELLVRVSDHQKENSDSKQGVLFFHTKDHKNIDQTTYENHSYTVWVPERLDQPSIRDHVLGVSHFSSLSHKSLYDNWVKGNTESTVSSGVLCWEDFYHSHCRNREVIATQLTNQGLRYGTLSASEVESWSEALKDALKEVKATLDAMWARSDEGTRFRLNSRMYGEFKVFVQDYENLLKLLQLGGERGDLSDQSLFGQGPQQWFIAEHNVNNRNPKHRSDSSSARPNRAQQGPRVKFLHPEDASFLATHFQLPDAGEKSYLNPLSQEESSFKNELENLARAGTRLGPQPDSELWHAARAGLIHASTDQMINSLVALFMEGKEDVVLSVLSAISQNVQKIVAGLDARLSAKREGLLRALGDPTEGDVNPQLSLIASAKDLLMQSQKEMTKPEYITEEKTVTNQVKEDKVTRSSRNIYKSKRTVETAQMFMRASLGDYKEKIGQAFAVFSQKPSLEVRLALLDAVAFYHSKLNELYAEAWPFKDLAQGQPLYIRNEKGEYVVAFDYDEDGNAIPRYQQANKIAYLDFATPEQIRAYQMSIVARAYDIESVYFDAYFEELFESLNAYATEIVVVYRGFEENPSHSVAELLKAHIETFGKLREEVGHAINQIAVSPYMSRSFLKPKSSAVRLNRDDQVPVVDVELQRALLTSLPEDTTKSRDQAQDPLRVRFTASMGPVRADMARIRQLQDAYLRQVAELSWEEVIDVSAANPSAAFITKIESMRSLFSDLLIK